MSNKVDNMTSLAEQTDMEHDGVQMSIANSPGKDDRPTARWKSACLDFVDSTTLHGLRFVFLDHASRVRRLLWLGVLLTCAGLMVYQIAERVQYFLKRPVAVNLEINYNSSLPFPAVTVCNQNSFRASFAFDEDWYDMIEDFVYDSYPTEYPNMTIDEMFRRAAHRKEDFIQGCKWGGEVCSPENFTEVFTDHGLCFTFNYDRENPLHIHSTGSANGLRLTLNVESYEEMIGPHQSLGVKLLVHDQKDVPMVEALGLAVPPGSHAFVGVQLQVVDNLPPPHGECGSQPSEFFPPERYTVDSCQLSCLTSQLRQTCGCRHHFMPHVNGSPPVCTLEQFHECYRTNIANLTEIASQLSHCPVPCRSGVYDPVISVGTLSSGAISNYLFNDGLLEKTGEMLRSKGKSDSFNIIHRTDVHFIVSVVHQGFRLLERNLTKVSDDFASNKDKLLREEEMEFYNVISTRLHLLRWQEFHMARNLLRLWDEMEGTLGILLYNPWHFAQQLQEELPSLNASSGQEAVLLEAILTKEIRNSIGYLSAAKGDYEGLQFLFESGIPYRNDQYENYTARENFLVTPSQLLQGQVTEKELDLPSQCLENASLALKSWKAMLSDIRENHTLNYTLVSDLRNQFVSSMADFRDSVIVVHSKVFQPPQDVILSEIQTSQSLQPAIELRFREHKQHLQAILKLQEKMTNATIPAIEDILSHIYEYTYEQNKTTKMDLARLLSENVVHIDDFQLYFGDMASKVEAVQNNLNKLQSQMEDLWESVWADRTELWKAYAYFNYTELRIDRRDDKLRTLASRFDRSREFFRAMDARGPQLKNFNDGLQTLALMMADFASEPKFWGSYLQDNIVKVDIYFRERKYEHVTQQVAYDESAFLSDIGGSVGLFLGASVLTLFELIDLILRQIICQFTHNVPA